MAFWQVRTVSVREGRVFDFHSPPGGFKKKRRVYQDGTCRGVVDTGTSHLGVPGPYDKDLILWGIGLNHHHGNLRGSPQCHPPRNKALLDSHDITQQGENDPPVN